MNRNDDRIKKSGDVRRPTGNVRPKGAPPRSDGRTPPPRSDGRTPPPRSDGRTPPPRRHDNRAPSREDRMPPGREGFIEKIRAKMTPKMTALAAAGAVLLALVVCMLVNIFIGVRRIEVIGNSLAGAEEIAAAAGISEGSGYFSYNTGRAEKDVLESIKCISDIKISRSVFGRVRITVTEKNACWYTEVYGEYYALSDSLEVIRHNDIRDEFINYGLVRVDFPEVKSTVLGRAIEYADEDRDCSYIPEFLDEIRETPMYKEGRLNQIRMENKFKIYAVCDLKYRVSLGKSENVSIKLSSVSEVIKRLDESGNCVINATDVSNISVYPDEELDFSYLTPVFGK